MNMYFIVGNRAFTQESEAKKYCEENDFDDSIIVEAAQRAEKQRYFELQTRPYWNHSIFHNVFLTEKEMNSPAWQETIENYRSGEYTESLVHLKEISEDDYKKYTAA